MVLASILLTDTPQIMPKRSRQDSPSPTPSTASPPSESDTPSPASTDIQARSLRASTEPSTYSNKYIQTSEKPRPTRAVMKCSLPPHNETLAFPSFEDFEVHYNKVHANRCTECRRNFPTEYFLGLHISENHDPLEEARRAKGEKTYRCFVTDCDRICSTPHKRRMHLTDKHMFPKNYDFLIVNTGIDKRSSMLRTKRHRRKSSAASRALHREHQQLRERPNSNPMDLGSSPEEPMSPEASSPVEEKEVKSAPPVQLRNTNKTDMDELTSTMSALNFVPPSVRFGRGGRRGGLARS